MKMGSDAGGNKSALSIKDLFAKVQANLEKQGAFHVGKCHGKPIAVTTVGGGGGCNSRSTKERVRNSPVKTSLFQSQLVVPTGPPPDRAPDNVDVEANDKTPSRSQSPDVDEDSKPPPYIPVCMRNNAQSELPTPSSMPGVSSLKPSFQSLSWAAPSFDTGMGLSSVGIALSESKKRPLDEITAYDQRARTATANIAAAAAAASASDSFFLTSGPRFTREEADDYASFADKWIPTGCKKARGEAEND